MSLVLVTGARGFIGRHLVSWLSRHDHDVIGIGHGTCSPVELDRSGLKAWAGDDLSVECLQRLQADWGIPDAIFHLAGGSSVGAAIANPGADFSKTVTSTCILLEWMRCHANTAQLVAVSSAAVYGSGHNGGISEHARLTPYSPYGSHKLMMEILCQSYASNFDLRIVLPRLFSVYGVELRKQLLWDLCNKLAADGKVELGGTGDELRDWTHISDVVRGLAAALDLASNRSPVLNLATGIATPVREIASMVASQWGGESARQRLHFNGLARVGDPFSLVADAMTMETHGIECAKPVALGIVEYVNWFREHLDSN